MSFVCDGIDNLKETVPSKGKKKKKKKNSSYNFDLFK